MKFKREWYMGVPSPSKSVKRVRVPSPAPLLCTNRCRKYNLRYTVGMTPEQLIATKHILPEPWGIGDL